MNSKINFGDQFKKYIQTFDFQGVTYYDCNLLTSNHQISKRAFKIMSNMVRRYNPTIILGVESRGFVSAAKLDRYLEIGMRIARKAGKVPGEVYSIKCDIEYGSRTFELEKDAFKPGDRVLIVDDVLATGGTTAAIEKLVEMTGAQVVGSCFIIEILGLGGASRLSKPHFSLINMKLNENTNIQLGTNIIPNIPRILNSNSNNNLLLRRSVTTSNSNLAKEPPIALMCCPSTKVLVDMLINLKPNLFCYRHINWGSFPDGYPNIKFDPSLLNKHVCFIGSLFEYKHVISQLMMNIVIPRQGAKSFTLIYPYYAPGTMERVDNEGDMATAEALAT